MPTYTVRSGDMSDAEPRVIDGVRMGPRVASSAQTDNATPTQERAK